MEISTTPLTISQLFNTSDQYFIPSYQRRYAWTEDEQKALFDDIDNINNNNHLFGMIVCIYKPTNDNGIHKLELVDGQQRLTTIILLLLAIKNIFSNSDSDSEKYDSYEINNLIYCRDNNNNKESKMILVNLDMDNYNNLLNGRFDDNSGKNNLLNAYRYFESLLVNFDIKRLRNFKNNLLHKTKIIKLQATAAGDAYKLFETINNRGLKLTPTDLIKNFILGHASIINEDTNKEVEKLWSRLIQNLDEIDTDDFFRQYMCMILKNKVTINKLVDEFRKYYIKQVEGAENIFSSYRATKVYAFDNEKDFENDNTNEEESDNQVNDENNNPITKIPLIDFLQEIIKVSLIYKKINNCEFVRSDFNTANNFNKINIKIRNLQWIGSKPSFIFLLNLFQRKLSINTNIDILQLIETFMLYRNICKARTGELDSIFAQLVNVSDNDILNNVRNQLRKDFPNEEDFSKNLITHDFKAKENRARYILTEIENKFNNNQEETNLNDANSVHIEHIIPKTLSKSWLNYLGDDSEKIHKDFVFKIGNLTLLSGGINQEITNNIYENKKIGYRNSTLKLNKNILENYDEFRFEEITRRSNQLKEIALEIWKF